MKNLFLALIIFSVFSTGVIVAQDATVAVVPKPKTTVDIEPSKGYVFGPGDEISGKVMGEPDYNFLATVDENGRIELPFSESSLVAQCKSEKELKADIDLLLAKYLVKPQWSLRVEKRARPAVTIFGEVKTVTKVDLTRRATLLEMVALAGGENADAGGIVQVYRPQKALCTAGNDASNWLAESGDPGETPSRVYSLAEMNLGKEESNPVIMPGDVIYIPKAPPAYIVGEVVAPQGILLKRTGGTTLWGGINLVQGLRPEAKTKEVKIYRRKLGSDKTEVLVANLELIKKGLQPDIYLEPYDVVEVGKTKKSIALTIAEFALGAGKSILTSASNQAGVRVVY